MTSISLTRFVIRLSSFSLDIADPDEHPAQSLPRDLRARGAAHGACDFDATPEKRGLGRGIWRGGYGKHFRRANHQRAGEVHRLARWHFFRHNLYTIDPLCP